MLTEYATWGVHKPEDVEGSRPGFKLRTDLSAARRASATAALVDWCSLRINDTKMVGYAAGNCRTIVSTAEQEKTGWRGIQDMRGGKRVAYHIVRGKVQHDGNTTAAGHGEHDSCGLSADERGVLLLV